MIDWYGEGEPNPKINSNVLMYDKRTGKVWVAQFKTINDRTGFHWCGNFQPTASHWAYLNLPEGETKFNY